jgi:hypothetical protein
VRRNTKKDEGGGREHAGNIDTHKTRNKLCFLFTRQGFFQETHPPPSHPIHTHSNTHSPSHCPSPCHPHTSSFRAALAVCPHGEGTMLDTAAPELTPLPAITSGTIGRRCCGTDPAHPPHHAATRTPHTPSTIYPHPHPFKPTHSLTPCVLLPPTPLHSLCVAHTVRRSTRGDTILQTAALDRRRDPPSRPAPSRDGATRRGALPTRPALRVELQGLKR